MCAFTAGSLLSTLLHSLGAWPVCYLFQLSPEQDGVTRLICSATGGRQEEIWSKNPLKLPSVADLWQRATPSTTKNSHGMVCSGEKQPRSTLSPRLRSDTYMVRAAATSAAPVAVLTGCPLCRGGIWVLPLARHGSDGTEHLGGHILREGVHCTGQVCKKDHCVRQRAWRTLYPSSTRKGLH